MSSIAARLSTSPTCDVCGSKVTDSSPYDYNGFDLLCDECYCSSCRKPYRRFALKVVGGRLRELCKCDGGSELAAAESVTSLHSDHDSESVTSAQGFTAANRGRFIREIPLDADDLSTLSSISDSTGLDDRALKTPPRRAPSGSALPTLGASPASGGDRVAQQHGRALRREHEATLMASVTQSVKRKGFVEQEAANRIADLTRKRSQREVEEAQAYADAIRLQNKHEVIMARKESEMVRRQLELEVKTAKKEEEAARRRAEVEKQRLKAEQDAMVRIEERKKLEQDAELARKQAEQEKREAELAKARSIAEAEEARKSADAARRELQRILDDADKAKRQALEEAEKAKQEAMIAKKEAESLRRKLQKDLDDQRTELELTKHEADASRKKSVAESDAARREAEASKRKAIEEADRARKAAEAEALAGMIQLTYILYS